MIDSADMSFTAKAQHLLIFKHYVRMDHWLELYASPMSEAEFMNNIPKQGKDETSFVPAVSKAGKYTYAICSKGSDFYACDVSIGYEYLISTISVITPQEMGERFTIELLDSAVKLTDQRVKEYMP